MKGLIFTYALTYGGAAVAVFNPFYGLLVYICFAILRPPFLWYWSVPFGNYSQIIAIGMLAGWALQGFGDWRLGRAWGVIVAICGFWLWALTSAVFAATDADAAQVYLMATIKIVLPVLVGITTIRSLKQLQQLAWVMAVCQGYIALEMNLSYYSGFNRITQIGFGGADNNVNAIAMATGAGMAFFLGLHSSKLWHKAIAFGAAALMVHAVMFAFSRGGMLSLLVMAGVSFYLLPKRPKHYALFVLAILLALRLAGPEVRERFTSAFLDEQERDVSAQSRVDMWRDCWTLMKENPLLGVGPKHWPLYGPRFGWPEGKEAHSLWLQTGAELGFVGLGLLLLYYGLCCLRLTPLARARGPTVAPFLQSTARMVIAGLAGFAASATFVTVEGLELPYYVALLGAGALKLSPIYTAQEAAEADEDRQMRMAPLPPAGHWRPLPLA